MFDSFPKQVKHHPTALSLPNRSVAASLAAAPRIQGESISSCFRLSSPRSLETEVWALLLSALWGLSFWLIHFCDITIACNHLIEHPDTTLCWLLVSDTTWDIHGHPGTIYIVFWMLAQPPRTWTWDIKQQPIYFDQCWRGRLWEK